MKLRASSHQPYLTGNLHVDFSMDSLKNILGPNVGIDLAAGSVGGAAQVIVGQPLDTIKTRAQIAPKGMFLERADGYPNPNDSEGGILRTLQGDGFSSPRNRWGQLTTIRILRDIQTNCFAFP